ncbi:MAG: hypothetical protein EHM80_06885 [Nitrospiraceae bacterium]|nr:MAG: hypothetical protein EHM80_06885 [Nitrospiraceae bacterium]
MNGEEAVGAATTEPVEVISEGGAAIELAMEGVVVGGVPFSASEVARVAWPAAISDVDTARDIWEEVAGAVIEAMAGRLVNVR